MNPIEAEKLQDEIYRKMPASQKIKIAGEFFLLGKKLGSLRKQKNNEARRPSLQNSENFRRA